MVNKRFSDGIPILRSFIKDVTLGTNPLTEKDTTLNQV
jgi:hypothetical protein